MRNKFTFRFTLILLFCTCFLSIAQSKFGDKRVLPIDDIFKTWNILKDFKVDVSMDSSQSSNGNYSALVSCSKTELITCIDNVYVSSDSGSILAINVGPA